jgi:glucan 1,3-beta-glucosidase
MHYAPVITLVSLVLCVRGQLLDIPAVDELVQSALRPLADWTDYDGPTGTASSDLTKSTKATVHANIAIEAAAVTDASYWLASISHQGKAAFNSNPSSYTVFRNVLDYGAKGNLPVILKSRYNIYTL